MQKRIRQEIKHFSNLEHIWWGAKTIAGQKRYDNKAKLFKKYCHLIKGGKVLEIGCGDGEFTKRIADERIKIIATDVTPAVIKRAKKNLESSGVSFCVDNAEGLSFDDRTFNVVCGISVLHHLNTLKALEEAYRVLKTGGELFFTEPNLLNPVVFFGLNLSFLRKRMEFSPDETALVRWTIADMLNRIGFRKVEVRNYDFLLPHTPPQLINTVMKLSDKLEKIPIVKEFSGSLVIYAVK